MKKIGIIIIVCILVCIAGGSFLAIHLIRNDEVSETSISNVRPVNYEKTEAFTSVQLDLTSMDVQARMRFLIVYKMRRNKSWNILLIRVF